MRTIPYGKQQITDEDIAAVAETLQSDFLTQGPKIKEFEDAFARYVGSKYAVCVSNGTAALHLSTLALNVSKGDRIITTPITFAASANCVRYCEGEVVFCDINPEDYLLDLNKLEKLLSVEGKGYYKGIICVDFAGRAVDLEKISALAKEYGLWVLEDACHAPGAFFTDKSGTKQYCGNGEFADLTIFSFHPVKHIACGEGGMITTNNKVLYERLLTLRTHGITRDSQRFQNSISEATGLAEAELERMEIQGYPGWYMEMQGLGFNYRLTDFQAALGVSQLKRADAGLARRRDIAKRYCESFQGKPFLKGQSGVIDGHAYHLYIIEVEDRLGLYNYLRSKDVFAQIHYIPLHRMPYYKGITPADISLPVADNYYKHCISLPMYPALTDEDQGYVIEQILNYYNG